MEKTRRKFGFTIVELLTVMAIIAILMGLLLPAMQAVRKAAKDVSQKAQFKTIQAALEGFHNENGVYPDSSISTTSNVTTVGAQKLAEALVGRDLLGFDTKSSWDAKNDEIRTDYRKIYSTLDNAGTTADEVSESLKRRQSIYVDVDKVGAFQVNQLFNACYDVYPGNLTNTGTKDTGRITAPVLTDTYKMKKVTLANGNSDMAGTPILYYKADTSSVKFPDTMLATVGTGDDFTSNYIPTIADACEGGYIYNFYDNENLLELNQMMKPTIANQHHFFSGYQEKVSFTTGAGNAVSDQTVNGIWLFYSGITNQKMSSQVRPHNSNSYILVSAGYDGIYGTKDDIYNFEK